MWGFLKDLRSLIRSTRRDRPFIRVGDDMFISAIRTRLVIVGQKVRIGSKTWREQTLPIGNIVASRLI